MSRINWLHLSDWHQHGASFDRKVVRDGLLKDLRDRMKIDPCLERIDFVVFSGDLAFNGKAEEYDAAQINLLDPVLDVVGLKPIPGMIAERLLIVPGNHDLRRETVYEMLPPELQKPLDSYPLVEKWLTEDKRRAHALEPFDDFRKFVSAYTGQTTPDFGSIRHFDVDGTQIALLGVNTAWMCGRHKEADGQVCDQPYLLTGEPQIHEGLEEIASAHLRIAVMHHPFEWLAQFDRSRVEARLQRACHFLLRGHTHQPKVSVVAGSEGESAVISAGAAYDRRVPDDFRYANAYNLVSLDFTTGEGTVFLRHWSDPRNAWIEDIDSAPRGQRSLELPHDLRTPKPDRDEWTAVSSEVRAATNLPAYCRDLMKDLTVKLVADAQRHCEVDRLYVKMEVRYADANRPDDDSEDEADSEGASREADEPHQKGASKDHSARKEQSPQSVGLCEAVRDNPNAILLAGPGAGKTTSLQWLAFQTARQHIGPDGRTLPPELAWLDGLTPILLSARALVDERERAIEAAESRYAPPTESDLFRFLSHEAAQARLSTYAVGCAREALGARKGLLLIDGLDEVPQIARQWVVSLASKFSDNRVVFSSRRGGYNPQDHAPATRPLYLRPFDRPRMALYLDLWFAYRRQWVDKTLSDAQIEVRRREILRAVDASTAIRSLAQTPLLLATMACVQELDVRLPENRAELYYRCTTLLLGKWDQEQRLPDGVPPSIETTDLIARIGGWDLPRRGQVIEIVAHRLFTKNDRLNPAVDRGELTRLLVEAIEEVTQKEGETPRNSQGQAKALLDLCARSSGLLTELARDRFAFLHATFQEYLTARRFRGAVTKNGVGWCDLLVEHCHEARWREVIRLTAAELVREPADYLTSRLNELMNGISTRLANEPPENDAWLEIAETCIGCLEDLIGRRFEADRTIAEQVIATASSTGPVPWEGPFRALELALRLPACLARRGMLHEVSLCELVVACFAALEMDWSARLDSVWAALRTLAGVGRPEDRQRMASCAHAFSVTGNRSQVLAARAFVDLCGGGTIETHIYRLAVESLFGSQDSHSPVSVGHGERNAWHLALQSCEEEPRLMAVCERVIEPLRLWSAATYARAAVRGFYFSGSREAGVRVMRGLLANTSSREAALAALTAGLADQDGDIAGTSASVLAGEESLPTEQGAQAAVRAFSHSGSNEAGVRVMRGLLANSSSREAALAALTAGLAEKNPIIAVTSASLLAGEESLPTEQGAQAAVRAFSYSGIRGAGVRVMRGLLANSSRREAALAALTAGLADQDGDIAGTSASLLAGEESLPTEQGAQAAVRAFSSSGSREAGVRVMRGLLANTSSREAALAALTAGLAERNPSIAGTSASVLAGEESLPTEQGAQAAVRAFSSSGSRGAGVRVMRGLLANSSSREAALAALTAALADQDGDIAGTSASLLAGEESLPTEQRAQAAVLAFSSSESRGAGMRVMRGLLANTSSREAALATLTAGLADWNPIIAVTSASILAGEESLPTKQGAQAAVRAFSSPWSRGAGVRVMRRLLANTSSREAALAALTAALADQNGDIAGTSASLLAGEESLPAEQRAQAAVRAFSYSGSKEAGVWVMRGLLANSSSREAALAALTAGLAARNPSIAVTSASLLAGEESLPTEQGAQAAVRAFSSPWSRGAGVRVMRRLLANTSSREAALAALTAGLADQEANVSATCRNLLDGEPTT